MGAALKRGLDRNNPWGLTRLEVAVMQALVEGGTQEKAAAVLGRDLHSVVNALYRIRPKVGVDNMVHLVARWVEWTSRPAASGPRSAWLCTACSGRGFLLAAPARVHPYRDRRRRDATLG